MRDFPFRLISSTSSVSPAFSADNSIIKTRNVDTLPPTEIALLAHPYCNVFYVCDCDIFKTYIDDCEMNYLPGNIYFNPPDTLHSPRNQFCGMLSSVSLKFYISDSCLAEKLGSVPFRTECDDEFRELFQKSIYYTKSSESASLSLLYENTESILNRLITAPKHLICTRDDAYDSRFIKVLKYMYANCGRDIDLGELANVAHMERTAFAKKFKSLYKITPINYLYSIRLSRSLDYLMTNDPPITEIAKIVGFKRATAFTASFTRTFGMTPTEYREKVAKIESVSKLRRA